MLNPISAITRSAIRKENEPLNILSACTHERYQSGLAKTNANYYLWRSNDGNLKDWEPKYAPLPPNHTLLDPNKESNQIPDWLDIDLVLSQNRFGQFQILDKIAKHLNIPHVNIEHTLPMPGWDNLRLATIKKMKADINIFISEFSREKWLWNEHEAEVIHHGIDTATFKPLGLPKKKTICSSVNKWSERQYICGFDIWKKATEGLPVNPIGDTPGFSKPADSIEDLVRIYNESQIFINTSVVSPIPMALLENMACGSCCVSTSTCMISEIIKNGYNGYITNDLQEMRTYMIMLLNDPEKCRKLGENARKTILERFSLDKFVENWDNIFKKAINLK